MVAQQWIKLGNLRDPNWATVFLAETIIDSGQHKMQEDSIDEVLRLSASELTQLIDRGELIDAKSLAALLLFERYAKAN